MNTKSKYKLAIFDMDGTILDTLEDLTDSLNYVLNEHNLPTHSIDNVRRFVGNGILRLIELAVPENTDTETINIIFDGFIRYYKLHCADKTKPYDGINDLVATLRHNGLKTAVVSNKADIAVQELCKQYFPGLFDYSVGERSGILKKPAPDSVNEVLNHLGISNTEAVYIGDSEVDVATAKNADMDSIIVLWGFRDRDFLIEHGGKNFVTTTKEIEKIIL